PHGTKGTLCWHRASPRLSFHLHPSSLWSTALTYRIVLDRKPCARSFSPISSSRSAPPATSSPRSTSSAARSALAAFDAPSWTSSSSSLPRVSRTLGTRRERCGMNAKELVARDEDDAACVNTNVNIESHAWQRLSRETSYICIRPYTKQSSIDLELRALCRCVWCVWVFGR